MTDVVPYRERIYRQYGQSASNQLIPRSPTDLDSRSSFLNHFVKRYFPSNRDVSVFDVGCGHGALLYFARRLGYLKVAGVDASVEQIAGAAALGLPGVRQGDLLRTVGEMPDQCHDVIVAFDVLEHLTKDELFFAVDHIARILRPGGCLLIHVPNAESPFGGRIRYGDLTHEQAFTAESMTQLLKIAGFVDIQCSEDEPVPHGLTSALRWFLWKCIRLILRAYIAVETGDMEPCHFFSQNFVVTARKRR